MTGTSFDPANNGTIPPRLEPSDDEYPEPESDDQAGPCSQCDEWIENGDLVVDLVHGYNGHGGLLTDDNRRDVLLHSACLPAYVDERREEFENRRKI